MSLPRCSAHKDRAVAPRLCHICQRMLVEHEIAERTVKVLFAEGFQLLIENGDSERLGPFAYQSAIGMQPSADLVLAEMFQTDDEFLVVKKGAANHGWVRFVYGNDGWDVISDYTTNLEDVLKPVADWAEKLS